ncbi:MAG: DUF2254 domain-containing protein [Ramlibacter sp.]|nr:DUF2254 domain-containing protein [Ramlibacter sp.]
MSRLSISWQAVRASFWFVPGLVVLASMAAALALVEFDGWKTQELAEWSPRLFGASANGSRAMLSAIATSMITVAGVVFSITIVALSLTATQYSPGVLRNFMRDRPTQWVLGVFLGIFAYCLIVLRTIRGSDAAPFIPSVAVLAGMVYAFIGIALLIYFIHHVAQSMQAAMILQRISDDSAAAIDHLFPESLGEDPPVHPGRWAVPLDWTPVESERSGYVITVDSERLMRIARDTGRVLRLTSAVGSFVASGSVVVDVGGSEPLEESLKRKLRGSVLLGLQRTTDQDAAFGFEQLVDVALKALSPGINDPTTACMCVDRLGDLLGRVACRRLPQANRFEDGQLRVIAPAPGFAELLTLSLRPVLHHLRGDMQVLDRIRGVLCMLEARTRDAGRRADVLAMVEELRRELQAVRPAERATEALRQLGDLERKLVTWSRPEGFSRELPPSP